jgi:membrane-bound ClpP family serine protease
MSFDSGPGMVNGVEGMAGEEAVVSKDIPGAIHLGQVRARGEDWPAVSASGEPIAAGTIVLILEVTRGHLSVTPSAGG